MNETTENEKIPADFSDWLKTRCEKGGWFVSFDEFLEIMSIEAAWTLLRIINAGKQKPKGSRQMELWREGWIRWTVEFAQDKTKMSQDAQNRVLKSLRGKGNAEQEFIEVGFFGIPRKRHVRIDTSKLDKAIHKAVQSLGKPIDWENPLTGKPRPLMDEVSRPLMDEVSRPLLCKETMTETMKETDNDVTATETSTTVETNSAKVSDESALKQKQVNGQCVADRVDGKKVTDKRTESVGSTPEATRRLGWAEQLLSVIKETVSLGVIGKGNPTFWAEDFALIEEKFGESRVSIIMTWLLTLKGNNKKWKELGLPDVRCPKNLLVNFDWVERCRQQDEKNKPIKISEEARKLTVDLKYMHWPKGSKEQLATAVQTSIDNYREFLKKRHQFIQTVEEGRLKQFVKYSAEYTPTPIEFVRSWFEGMNRQVQDWPDWSGNLSIFKVNSKDFRKIFMEWAGDYCLDSDKLCDQFLEMLK